MSGENFEDLTFEPLAETQEAETATETPADAETPAAPVDPAPEPEAETPADPAPETDEAPQVPDGETIAAIRRDYQAKVQALEDRLAQVTAQPQAQAPEPEPVPDLFEDPEGYKAHVASTAKNAALEAKLDVSEYMAREQHGDEVVNTAYAALKAANDPSAVQKVQLAKSPWHALVKWYQGQKFADEIGGDPDAYKAKVREEILAEMEAKQVAQQVKQTPAPPASLSDATSVGSRTAPEWSGPTPLADLIPDR